AGLFPVVACIAVLGWNHVLVQQGLFFSKAALVTFGGAYAVLPYVAQQAVETHGWVTAVQMMDGLALAETTPGPLILVLQFVGFLGGWSANSVSSPMLTATLAAMMTSWVTFIPGFLFIFAGAPYIERTRGNLRLNAALSAVTAAVVGVVLNLAVWFAWHVVLPESGRVDVIAVCAAIFFFVALQRWKWDVLVVIGVAGLLGLVVLGVGLI
ncbi:MAG: chromate transporter, partial [Chthoniobacterales bacterium]